MVLPDNFTIKLPPDWPTDSNGRYHPLKWFVTNKLTFGINCVIDLSPQEPSPSKPATGARGSNGGVGRDGGNGGTGADGADGISGADLLLDVQTWEPTGSLF